MAQDLTRTNYCSPGTPKTFDSHNLNPLTAADVCCFLHDQPKPVKKYDAIGLPVMPCNVDDLVAECWDDVLSGSTALQIWDEFLPKFKGLRHPVHGGNYELKFTFEETEPKMRGVVGSIQHKDEDKLLAVVAKRVYSLWQCGDMKTSTVYRCNRRYWWGGCRHWPWVTKRSIGYYWHFWRGTFDD